MRRFSDATAQPFAHFRGSKQMCSLSLTWGTLGWRVAQGAEVRQEDIHETRQTSQRVLVFLQPPKWLSSRRGFLPLRAPTTCWDTTSVILCGSSMNTQGVKEDSALSYCLAFLSLISAWRECQIMELIQPCTKSIAYTWERSKLQAPLSSASHLGNTTLFKKEKQFLT